jgi:hypothetical protein
MRESSGEDAISASASLSVCVERNIDNGFSEKQWLL